MRKALSRDVARWVVATVACVLVWAVSPGFDYPSRRLADVRFLENACILATVIAGALVDARHRVIPNAVPAAVVALHVIALCLVVGTGEADVLALLGESAAGATVLGGGLFAFTAGYEALRHADAMGGGDLKLVFALGFSLGLARGALVVLLACAVFAVRMAVAVARSRWRSEPVDHTGPFCPSLAVALFLVPLLFP